MSAVLPSTGGFPAAAPPAGHGHRHGQPLAAQPPAAPAPADGAAGGIGLLRANTTLRSPQGAGSKQGLLLVIALHLLLGWALASGLARQAVEVIKKPIQMAVIQEAPPPPPPPPPKIEKIKDVVKAEVPPPPAYVPPPEFVPVQAPPPPITQVQAEPPKTPVEIAPPAAPAPPPPPAKPAVVKQEVAAACPGHQNVLAQNLEDVFDRVGITGTVVAVLKVRGSQIAEVLMQSGPPEYYKYVQTAAKRLRCNVSGADEVQVTLPVSFRR